MRIIVISLFCIIFFSSRILAVEIINNDENHIATVLEVIKDGQYSFIKCDENGKSKWLMTFEVHLTVGEWIEFPDSPPTYNFKSDTINKRFSELYVVPGLRKITKAEAAGHSRLYKDEDEDGTLVFTDDPSKLSVKRGRK